MKQKCQVHCLPTNKATIIGKGIYKVIEGQFFINQVGELKKDLVSEYHLYITTNESPKENDWYCSPNGIISQHNGSEKLPDNWRKIVATTDKELLINYKGETSITKNWNGIKLPQISPEFQQAYVREANNGNPIVDAQMEFDEYYNFNIGDKLIVNKNVFGFKKDSMITVESIKNEIIHFEEDDTHKQGFHISHLIHKKVLQPKLNEQGYVTILPIVEKLYSKEEVIKLMDVYACYCLEAADEPEGTALKHTLDFL